MSETPKDDKASEGETVAPEVEAELVGDLDDADQAFDDAEPAADDAPTGAAPSRSLTPGVIVFIVFAVLALAAFFVWRFQQKPAAPQPEPVASSDALAPPAEEPAAPEAAAEQAPQPAQTPIQEPMQEPRALPPADDASKIANAPVEEKPDIAEAPEAPEAGADLYLPPVSAGGGNEDLQRAAKEAIARFGLQADEDAPESAAGAEGEAADDDQEPALADEIVAPDADAAPPVIVPADEPALEAGSQAGALPDQNGSAPADAIDEQDGASAPAPAAAKIDNAALIDERLKAANAELLGELAAMRAENRALSERIAGLEAAMAEAFAARGANDDARLAAIEAGLLKLQNSAPERPTNAQAAQLLARLGAALDAGAPYADALDRLRPAAPAELRLDHLSALAVSGAPTLAALKADFDDAARAGLAAANSARAPRGWGGLVARAQNLFSIRPATPTDGDDAGAIIARADYALASNELGAALGELAAAPQPMRAAMTPWLARAQARADALRDYARLQEALLGAAIGN